MHYPYSHQKTKGHNKGRIIDVENKDLFSIIFHSTKALEEFQAKSDMDGNYTLEYQHHFWTAVGRMSTINEDGYEQQLDIAIPLVLFNYEQEVGGTSVAFHLTDVEEAAETCKELAHEKMKELAVTKLFGYLSSIGITDWEIHALNSIHVHPNGINSFSGTDYKDNINNPGVVFPCSEGKNIPTFAGIIQHREGKAELIHMEYRRFDNNKDDRIYQHGRCLTVVKGFEEPYEEPRPRVAGVFDRIFGTKPQEKHVEKPKDRPSYVLTDNFDDAEPNVFHAFGEELQKLWDECDFEPDTSMIDPDEIVEHRYVRGSVTKNFHKQTKSLFPEQNADGFFRYNDMAEFLYACGYEKDEISGKPYAKLKELYIMEKAFEEEGAGYEY